MHYVYFLQSIPFPERTYIGQTKNLKKRLGQHNSGESSHASRYVPWKLVTYVAFTDEAKAIAFEKYLKTASGRAFANKRFRCFVPSDPGDHTPGRNLPPPA